MKPYKPTKADIDWMRKHCEQLVANGGILSMPGTKAVPTGGMIYRVNRRDKTLTLTAPAWDLNHWTVFCHHHNSYICKAIGWTCLPAVAWETMDASPPKELKELADKIEPREGWEDITAECQTEPNEKIPVTMLGTTHDGKRYGAGKIYISVGGGEGIACIAMIAGDKKWVLPDDIAVGWLIENGLPKDIAEQLVKDAMARGGEE